MGHLEQRDETFMSQKIIKAKVFRLRLQEDIDWDGQNRGRIAYVLEDLKRTNSADVGKERRLRTELLEVGSRRLTRLIKGVGPSGW